jgi:hypothetical protein
MKLITYDIGFCYLVRFQLFISRDDNFCVISQFLRFLLNIVQVRICCVLLNISLVVCSAYACIVSALACIARSFMFVLNFVYEYRDTSVYVCKTVQVSLKFAIAYIVLIADCWITMNCHDHDSVRS